MDRLEVGDENLRENTPTMSVTPCESLVIEVKEATQEFNREKALLSTQYGWEDLDTKTQESFESDKVQSRRRVNNTQKQSLNEFQTLTAITKHKKKMGDGNFKQRLLSNTALKKLEIADNTPKKRFQNAVRRVVNEIRFTKLFGHVKKTELEKVAKNANHALLLNRKEQEQKVNIEMLLKLEIKETALKVLEKTESAYKKIFWNRNIFNPSDEFKEFVREVTEKKNQYRDELNTQLVETKENTGFMRKNGSTFGHDYDDTLDYLTDEDDQYDVTRTSDGGRKISTFTQGIKKIIAWK